MLNTDEIINFHDLYYGLLPYLEEHSGIEFAYNKPIDVAYKISVLYGILFVEVSKIIIKILLFCSACSFKHLWRSVIEG